MVADKILGDEMVMHEANDYPLYQRRSAWKTNYQRKMVKGVRDNFVPEILRSYKKQFGDFGRVSKETKEYIAIQIVEQIEEDIKDDGRN